MELFWEPLSIKPGGGNGRSGLVAGPFRIVPDNESLSPAYTCILEGPDNLVLQCGSIRDALAAAEALAESMDGEEEEDEDEDEDDDEEEEDEDEDGTLSFLPPPLAARERARG